MRLGRCRVLTILQRHVTSGRIVILHFSFSEGTWKNVFDLIKRENFDDFNKARFKLSDELLAELLDALLLALSVRSNVGMDELEDVHRGASHLRLRIHCSCWPCQLRRHLQNGKDCAKCLPGWQVKDEKEGSGSNPVEDKCYFSLNQETIQCNPKFNDELVRNVTEWIGAQRIHERKGDSSKRWSFAILNWRC